jgi:hypothetical protein
MHTTPDESARRVSEAAKKVYEEKLRAQLEPQCIGQIIAIEPESGDYVLGRTFQEVSQALRTRFRPKQTYMFRVGGGGAVKIRRSLNSGRTPRRT